MIIDDIHDLEDISEVVKHYITEATYKLDELRIKGRLYEGDFITIWDNIACALYLIHLAILSKARIEKDKDRVYYGIIASNYNKVEQLRRAVCTGQLYMDTSGFYARTITENCIVLRYLIKNEDDVRRFQLNGLKHLAYYRDCILKNIKDRGATTDWEEGLLKSIKSEYDKIHATDLEVSESKKLGSIEAMARKLDILGMYNVGYRENSINMHCNWEYISKRVFHSLDIPELRIKDYIHLNQLNPITMYVIKTNLEFIKYTEFDSEVKRCLNVLFVISYVLDVMHHFCEQGKAISGIDVDLAINKYLDTGKLIYSYE